jgi:hypothetical protein
MSGEYKSPTKHRNFFENCLHQLNITEPSATSPQKIKGQDPSLRNDRTEVQHFMPLSPTMHFMCGSLSLYTGIVFLKLSIVPQKD